MREARTAAAMMVSAVLSVGCSHTVDGVVKPAPNLPRRPLSAETIQQVPLDDAALEKLLDQSLVSHDPPEAGGPDKLFDSKTAVTPTACQAVSQLLQKRTYGSADVQGVTSQNWLTSGAPGKVMLVVEGVVALPTAAQADAVFAKLSKQWQECSRKTVLELNGPVITINSIGDVHITDDVAAATNTVTTKMLNLPPLLPTRQSRAMGVELNCIIEAEVVLFTGVHASDPGSANGDSGRELVRAMQHKITDLG